MSEPALGWPGRLAQAFQDNPLTPILALAGLLLGVFVAYLTPREEEPQIDVTFANVFVPFPGAAVADVEQTIAYPAQQVLSAIEGVKHVYAVSRPGGAVITVEFEVGIPRRDAIVRIYNQVFSRQDFLPPGLGAGPVLVRPMGIDDVPIMSVTLWQADSAAGAAELAAVAHTLESELKRLPGTRDVVTIGAPTRAIRVELDAARLANFGLVPGDVAAALRGANAGSEAGERVVDGRVVPVTVGGFLANERDIGELVLGLHRGQPVQLRDVARVIGGAEVPARYVWHRAAEASAGAPAVTIAIAKKPGVNAADVTTAVTDRIAALRDRLIPAGVGVAITRDYGATATAKALQLIQKLLFATLSVVALVMFALGRREALVVGAAVVLTLALTLAASFFLGFTLNRVSLFALIFSIGILVDDAIVVVENIHRHLRGGDVALREAIPRAVAEIGAPTILATFTVIAALLPMAFVTGLMGPYMRPIPINASAGMVLSLVVALVVTPWLALRLLRTHDAAHGDAAANPGDLRIRQFFESLLRRFVDGPGARRRRHWLYGGVALAGVASILLAVFGVVVLKMLPFDDKNEFQVVVDMPEGTPLESTNATLQALTDVLVQVPEVTTVQGYAGTSAPVNFNGLVRQYYLRAGANVGDLQVNLLGRGERTRSSHAIARAVRPELAQVAQRHGANIKLVEVPPGPPVLAPIVAIVHGPDPQQVRRNALALAQRFAATPGLVDIDTSVETPAPREVLIVDRARAARFGITQAAVAETLQSALSGTDVTFLRDGHSRYPVPVRLRLPTNAQVRLADLLAIRLRATNGELVALGELVRVVDGRWQQAAWHYDLAPVAYVFADEAGSADSPLYGMFDVVARLDEQGLGGRPIAQTFFGSPDDGEIDVIEWDGEWRVTYETFSAMGGAYAVGLVLVYLLIVAQFRAYAMPLLMMAPIPLTVIGVMPGHALLGAHFTATSMIGMIALAGIIVRNSILLVDFVQHALGRGVRLADAVIDACVVRLKPIALTAGAAALGALFILDDPIFNGLAIALVFGLVVSTALTLVVIPLLYVGWSERRARRTGAV